MQQLLLLALGSETVAIPISKVERVVEIDAEQIEAAGAEQFCLIEDEPVLVMDLAAMIGFERAEVIGPTPVVLAEVRGERVALLVEHLAGQQEIYVKPIPQLLSCARPLSGLTVLGDGSPIFLLDVNQLA